MGGAIRSCDFPVLLIIRLRLLRSSSEHNIWHMLYLSLIAHQDNARYRARVYIWVFRRVLHLSMYPRIWVWCMCSRNGDDDDAGSRRVLPYVMYVQTFGYIWILWAGSGGGMFSGFLIWVEGRGCTYIRIVVALFFCLLFWGELGHG